MILGRHIEKLSWHGAEVQGWWQLFVTPDTQGLKIGHNTALSIMQQLGPSVLHTACESGLADVVELLLGLPGVNVNAQDEVCACWVRLQELMQLLVK